MIERDHSGEFVACCDRCSASIDTECRTFSETTDYIKSNGWRNVKESDGWSNLCPDCYRSR